MQKWQFTYKEVGTLLKLAGLMESHHPQPVPLGLFHFPSLEEFHLGSLASHSWSELPSGQLLLTQCRCPSLCSHLGQILCLCPPLYYTQGWRVINVRCWRFCQHWGFWFSMYFYPSSYLQGLPALPHSGCLLCSCHTGKESQSIRRQSSLVRIT